MGVPSKFRLVKFRTILLLITLFTVTVLPQTVIKEKIIIKPPATLSPILFTNKECTINFIVSWSAGNYQGFIGVYGNEGWLTTAGWSSGGALNCTATSSDLSGVGYQIRLNLPENVTSQFTYVIVINGVTIQSGMGTLVGRWQNFAYTNIDFYPTYYTGFDFELIDSRYGWSTGELYMNRKANINLSPFLNCDTIPFLPNSALINLTIEPEIKGVSFFNWETRDTVGWSQTVGLDETSNYYVALLPDYFSNEERIIKVTASYNSYNKSNTLRIPPRYYSILIEPTRVYMNWLSKSVDVFGFLGDWEKPLPDTIQYNLEILNNSRLIDMVLWNNGERGKVFYNIPHDYGYFGFEVIPTSEKPLNDDTLKIRISTTDQRINPAEVEIIYPAQRIHVEFNPKTVMPGDTANVVLKKLEPDGRLTNFLEDQLFDFRIIGGEYFGTIFVPEYGDTTDEGWYVKQGFKFIASAPIENLPVESILMVKTSEGFAGSQLPENGRIEEEQRKINKSQSSKNVNVQKQNISVQKKTKDRDVSKLVMIGGADEQLWGIGKITIGESENLFYLSARFEKEKLYVGDTVNVIITKVDKDGNESNFPENTQFEVGIKEGCEVGNILTSNGQKGQYFINQNQPIRFIVNDSLEVDSAVVVLRIGVPQDNDTIYLPYSSFVQSQSNKSQPVELLHSKIGENLNVASITSEYCITNAFEYEAYSLAVGLVIPGDCYKAEQCDSPPRTPLFSVIDHPNGYLGYDICESESSNRVGGFHPLLDNFESAFEPYALKLCYNSSTDRWQITPHENTISIRAIVATCYNVGEIQRELLDVSEINNIPEDELCEALVSINKHFRNPIVVTPNIHFYWLKEVVYVHELEHLNVFRDSTIHLALKEKISLDGIEFSNFEEAIKSFNISCNQISDIKRVEKEAYNFYKQILKNILPEMKRKHRSIKLRTNETEFHSRSQIQNTVKKYSNVIVNRLKMLKINCSVN